ncbi:nitroreductase family protein [Neolewinella sp.]|uniref:nitroreductase family protein n=1 Tax=Neolewinella sp. TaxID=2993543 RepID=UPI003B52F3B1
MKNILKKLRRKQQRFVSSELPRLLSKHVLLAKLYYLLFSRAFDRELRSVLAGRDAYLAQVSSEAANATLLTRNIHRLEKGLLMRPRRDTFAAGFITETVTAFSKLVKGPQTCTPDQLRWFTDVLREYFSATAQSQHPVIERQRQRFVTLVVEEELDEVRKVPYKRTQRVDISFEDFAKLSYQRRSVRWFLDQPVPRALIDRAISVASQSPSACNRQPFRYVIIDDPAKIAKAVELPMGTRGYAHSIQSFIVCVGNLSAYFHERDRHLIYIDASLANMALMYSLEVLGLSSVPINWPDIEPRERMMQDFLGLRDYERPIMCMGVGYPDPEGMVAYSQKKDLDQLRAYA